MDDAACFADVVLTGRSRRSASSPPPPTFVPRSAKERSPTPRATRTKRAGKRATAVSRRLAITLLFAASVARVLAQEDAFAGRPGLADAEREPASLATCETLQRSLAGFRPPGHRVDLWVTGPLTLVHTDGVLWYLAICSAPGIRVMCVTYNDNGLRVGDRVTLRGAFRPQDERHVVLDPCLATRN